MTDHRILRCSYEMFTMIPGMYLDVFSAKAELKKHVHFVAHSPKAEISPILALSFRTG